MVFRNSENQLNSIGLSCQNFMNVKKIVERYLHTEFYSYTKIAITESSKKSFSYTNLLYCLKFGINQN